MHVLITGITMSGKTTLAKELARNYVARGINVIVLDPIGDNWPTQHRFTDGDAFMRFAKQSRSCMLFVDESGTEIGRYAGEMQWIATQARHWGHRSHFISQRPSQLDKTMRDQCSHLFLFRVSFDDCKVLANEFAQPELMRASALNKFEFIETSKFGNPVTRCLNYDANGSS